MLTLRTPSSRLSLARRRTATFAELLAVRAFGVGKRGEDRGGALLGRDEERRANWACCRSADDRGR
jgi:hypothetical protein